MDKEKLIIDYSFVSPTLEEQLNKYGVTLGDKAELVEKLKNAVLLLYVHDILTEGQEQRAIERLHKMVEKEMKMVRGDNVDEKLKPCPFCGCESVIIIDHEDGLGACDYYVACDRCSASGSFSDTLDDAIRKWNNRVINHGTWERHYMPSLHQQCSECGYIVDCSDSSNYCPMCGARMDKKE